MQGHLGSDRFAHLDVWRGVAIMSVLFGHFVGGGVVNVGRFGVELFFSLSGLLIGMLLFERGEPLVTYAINRVARVVPSLIIYVVVCSFGMRLLAPEVELKWEWFAFWTNPFPRMPVIFQHLWSIAIELQGYFILGVVAFLSRCLKVSHRFIIGAVVFFFIAMIAVKAVSGVDYYYDTYWRVEGRTIAMLSAAALFGTTWRWLIRVPALLLVSVAFGLSFSVVPDSIKYTVGSLFLACACVAFLGQGVPVFLSRHVIFLRVASTFGVSSYSIYLWQQVFYANADTFWKPLGLALSIGVGFAYHYGIDDRLHRWCKQKARGILLRPRYST